MSEKVWLLAMLAAFSSLLILVVFILVPIFSGEGITDQTRSGLDDAMRAFDELRKPERTP